ncbi:AraC family transcriptional regulator [Sphingobacterium cavernae]|uniref:AraC family transcriptional regulator n=1 Tax=Sphingobacterium cavernae TaxID=2592657 RepID=UPI00122FC1F3|nr:AraC family transcriptional regulator [Sphingobacterium cavernae]
MKPLFRKVPSQFENSFVARHDIMPNFGNVWHYHEEIELHYTIKGHGIRFIGDNISKFEPDEIILVGSMLSHAWRCNEEYYNNDPNFQVEAIVIQFHPDFLGKQFLSMPEMYLIPHLYEISKKGMVIKGENKTKIANLMRQCVHEEGMDKIITFLSILKLLAENQDYETLVNVQSTYNPGNETDNKRLNDVLNYTYANYRKDLNLEDVANMAHLSVTSFCRYFKSMTKKTYNDFLIEIRISHACRLLVENLLPTEVICFECGFNNVSNFYRHFKRVTNLTPMEYKKKYLVRSKITV